MKSYWLAASAACVITAAPAGELDLKGQYRAAVIDYFRVHAYATAVFSAGGQAVGAVYEITKDGTQFNSTRKDCFPTLKPPEATPSSLPELLTVNATAAAASLDSNFLGMFGGVNYKQLSSVQYTNVSSEQVSLKQLQLALDEKLCPELKPALSGAIIPPDQTVHKYYIIGTVLRAKQNTVISFADAASAGAVLKGIQARIASANLNLSASVDISKTDQKTISVTSSEPVVVAVRPAVVAEEDLNPQLNADSAPAKLLQTAWRDFSEEQPVKRASWLQKFFSGSFDQPK
jgi:hypothetical protein